jgi:hypothetical protein
MLRQRIGDILLDKKYISTDQRDYVLRRHQESKQRFGRLAVWFDFITDKDVTEVLSLQTGWPVWEDVVLPVARERIVYSADKERDGVFSIDNILKHGILPIKYEGQLGMVYVNPRDTEAFDYIVRDKRINPGLMPRFIIPEYNFQQAVSIFLTSAYPS